MTKIIIESRQLAFPKRDRLERRAIGNAYRYDVIDLYLSAREQHPHPIGFDMLMALDPEREVERLRSSQSWIDRATG